jgi:hypothetical protein
VKITLRAAPDGLDQQHEFDAVDFDLNAEGWVEITLAGGGAVFFQRENVVALVVDGEE